MMTLSRLSSRERVLGAAVLVVVVLTAFVGGVAHPLWTRARRLDAETSLLEEKLARLRAMAERQARLIPANADGVPSVQSPDIFQRTLVDQLEQWTRAGTLQINLIRLGVEVALEGAQSDVLALLDRVLAATAPMDVERLSLVSTASTERPVRLVLHLRQGVAMPGVESPSDGEVPSLERAAARPLFQADRGVSQEQEPALVNGGTVSGQWHLLGIVSGDPVQAVLADAQTQQTYVVRAGDRVGGRWIVERIAGDRVILQGYGSTLELSL